MKKIFTFAILVVLCAGCSTGIVSMGNGTYMVAYHGTDFNTMYGMKAKCLKKANQFCAKRGMAMEVVSIDGEDAQTDVFDDKPAACELIFRAVPTNSVSH
jgi:hypothetical protein